jgi:hypothetical protein
MNAAGVIFLAVVLCALSSGCASLVAATKGSGSGAIDRGGSAEPSKGIVADAASTASNAAVGPAPDPKDWKFVSVMVTGKVLDTLDAKSVTLDQAKAKCHAQATCTHVDVWKDKGKYYLKNGNDLPKECLDVTKRCSDGDWKDESGSGGHFHPDRGWGTKASSVEDAIKESECSSGSSCAKTKIMNILAMATVPFDVLGGAAGVGAWGGSTALTTFGRVAMIADTASDAATAVQLGSMISDGTKKSKSTGDYPYSNMPYISPTNYTIGTGSGPSYNNFIRSKHGCSGTGSANFRTDCREWAWTPGDQACKSKVKSVEYPEWQKAHDAWQKLPEYDGNFNPVSWKALFNSDSSPIAACEDANKGTLPPLVRASAQSGKLRASARRPTTSRSTATPIKKAVAPSRPVAMKSPTTRPTVRRATPSSKK